MSINVDKALDVRPPFFGEIYVSAVNAGPLADNGTFEIPGVRVSQGGGAEPENQHRFLANFISVQALGEDVHVVFGADPNTAANPAAISAPFGGNNPSPAPRGCIVIPAGETLRVDLTGLTQRLQLSPAIPGPNPVPATYIDSPVQYMGYSIPQNGQLRVWRSSGTGQ
ncbi:hypothetical protein OAK19_03730 [Aureispira]|nr:hypothetical protein [Aureispira sp.]